MNWSARLLNLTTGGFNRRTETKHYLTHSNASKFKYWHSFSFKWKHFKTSSSSPDSQSSAVKWRDERVLFFLTPSPPSFPRLIKWAFICMHESWKQNILKENTTPISLHRYESAIFQTSIRFSYFRACARARVFGEGSCVLAARILYSTHSGGREWS